MSMLSYHVCITEKFHNITYLPKLGNIHSVTECTVTEGGSVLMMRGFREILVLSTEGGREFVTVQAGATLLEIHRWLKEQGKEVRVAVVAALWYVLKNRECYMLYMPRCKSI